MTHEQWIKMSPEKQRIKVAELCGWRECDANKYGGSGFSPNSDHMQALPDYLNDLNAMHTAVNKISDSDYDRFCDTLWNICNGASGKQGAINATAAQRAEAFVMTMEAKS